MWCTIFCNDICRNYSRNFHHYKKRRDVTSKSIPVMFIAVFLLTIVLSFTARSVNCESSVPNETNAQPEGIHIAKWNWDHVGIYLTITSFVVLSGLAKVGTKNYLIVSKFDLSH